MACLPHRSGQAVDHRYQVRRRLIAAGLEHERCISGSWLGCDRGCRTPKLLLLLAQSVGPGSCWSRGLESWLLGAVFREAAQRSALMDLARWAMLLTGGGRIWQWVL